MAVWIIDNNCFKCKTKSDIVKELSEPFPYKIEINIKTFCIKKSSGWNIDFNLRPLAYLDIYFNNEGIVVKAILREREQNETDKSDGLGKVSEKNYKLVQA